MGARDTRSELSATISASAAASVEWDAVVIGAGPAGSVAATGLARAGLRTLVVDRVALPRAKVCGCCLSPSAVHTLRGLGLEGALRGASPLSSIRLKAGEREARFRIGDHVCVDREVFDTELAEAARDARAELLWPASARVRDDGSVRLETPSGAVSLRASAVVVADGLGGSSLRGSDSTAWRVRPGSRIGAGAMLDRAPVTLAQSEIVMICDRVGYIGFVRLPDGRVDAAAAFESEAMRAAGGPARLAGEILSRAGGDADAVLHATWRGTAALTRARAGVECGRTLVVGDAAGYVEPFTGEGMTWAIESGAAVVPHVLAIVRGTYRSGSWARARATLLGKRHLRCDIVAGLLRSPWAVGVAVRIGSAWPALPSMVAERFSRSSHRVSWGCG